MTALAVVIYLLLIAAVIGAIITIYSLFRSKSISMAGFAAGAVLFVVLLLLVSITNGSIKKETEGFIEKLYNRRTRLFYAHIEPARPCGLRKNAGCRF